MLAALSGTVTPEQAFTALRGYARAQRQRLSTPAQGVVHGAVGVDDIVAPFARALARWPRW